MSCLPDISDIFDDEPIFSDIRSSVELISTDWERVLFYAHRIKRIIISRVSRHILELIAISFPFEFVLPNLQYLNFTANGSNAFPYIRHSLGPKILGIELSLDGGRSCSSILPLLGSKYPSLQHIAISHTNDTTLSYMSSFVRQLTQLQTVSVGCPLDMAAILHLASLQTLTSLTIVMDEETPANTSRPPSLDPTFPSLRTLKIEASSSSMCAAVIRLLSCSPVDTLEIEIETPPNTDHAKNLFLAIHDHLSHSHLTTLDIYLGHESLHELDLAIYTIDSVVLQPCLAFGGLSRISISVPTLLCLDDPFLASMATAWPQAREIVLTSHPMGLPAPTFSATIPGLLPFARHCPLLNTLMLPLSGDFPPPWGEGTCRPQYSQNNLSTLRVSDSPIADPLRVAAFLSAAFPGLSTICLECAYSEDEKRWQEVERLLPMLVKLREQEKAHWQTTANISGSVATSRLLGLQ
ncbi:hypothetical protein C8R43DRAFT_1180450 [Mycena crocata]|nr:hypothetical protein C8R43DRAFT_1180450 [Mycena crocata]